MRAHFQTSASDTNQGADTGLLQRGTCQGLQLAKDRCARVQTETGHAPKGAPGLGQFLGKTRLEEDSSRTFYPISEHLKNIFTQLRSIG